MNSGACLVFFSGVQCFKSNHCEEPEWHADYHPPFEVKQSQFTEEHADVGKQPDEEPKPAKCHR